MLAKPFSTDKNLHPYDYDYIMDKMAKEELSIEEVEELARQDKIDPKSMILLQYDGPFHQSPYAPWMSVSPVIPTREYFEKRQKKVDIFIEMEAKRQARKERIEKEKNNECFGDK